MSAPCAVPARMWRVRIEYREPGYRPRAARLRMPYRWAWRIEAATAELAREAALAEFRRVSALSGVSWSREVVSIECRALEEDHH